MPTYILESDYSLSHRVRVANLEEAVEIAFTMVCASGGEIYYILDKERQLVGRAQRGLLPARLQFLPAVEGRSRWTVEDRPGWEAVVKGDTVEWEPLKKRD